MGTQRNAGGSYSSHNAWKSWEGSCLSIPGKILTPREGPSPVNKTFRRCKLKPLLALTQSEVGRTSKQCPCKDQDPEQPNLPSPTCVVACSVELYNWQFASNVKEESVSACPSANSQQCWVRAGHVRGHKILATS